MALVYGEEGPRGKFTGRPISEWGPEAVMAAWQRHLEARFFLAFMAKAGTYEERAAATKELLVADRKLAFWERHPAFDKLVAGRATAKVRSDWSKK